MEIDRDTAVALLKKYNQNPFHLRHAWTVEAVMRYFAKENGYAYIFDSKNLLYSCTMSILRSFPTRIAKKPLNCLRKSARLNDLSMQSAPTDGI